MSHRRVTGYAPGIRRNEADFRPGGPTSGIFEGISAYFGPLSVLVARRGRYRGTGRPHQGRRAGGKRPPCAPGGASWTPKRRNISPLWASKASSFQHGRPGWPNR